MNDKPAASGHIYKGERERWSYFTHLELESLPTGGWGYDHFPVSARYANTLGLEYHDVLVVHLGLMAGGHLGRSQIQILAGQHQGRVLAGIAP